MVKNNDIKILLVEDDAFLLKMYTAKFEAENFKTLTADNGIKAINIAKEKKPDVILLDILLPKIDGFEVLQALKENVRTKNIPVILLTNLSQKEEVKKGLDLGASDFLIKAHFMPAEVVEKVKQTMEDK